MGKRFREYIKSKEMLFSIYAIGTVFVVLLLIYFVMNLDVIFQFVRTGIHNFFGLRHRFGSVPLLHGFLIPLSHG